MFRVIADWLGLVSSGLIPRRDGLLRNGPRRWAVSLGLGLLLPFALAYYWAGLGLDELLFRGYRRRPIKRPVFILGVPRSGTTALHEALAQDPQFTTQRTWECLLAPSVSHRYLWRGLARLDRFAGGPLHRLAGWINRRWLAPLTGAHPLSARAPEEDYLSLLPHLSAFILVVAFPDSHRLWRLGRGDAALTQTERDRLMTRYRRSIQRHLHFHATDQTYLAKNASHATLVATLQHAFPEARFIACLRDPAEVVSSQLSSLTPGLEALHGRIDRDALSQRMLRQLHFGYTDLLSVLPAQPPGRAVFVPLPAQRNGLADTIREVYSTLDLALADAFAQRLATLDRQAREHRSGHRHSLNDYRLDAGRIAERFADVSAAFDFARAQPVSAADIQALEPQQRVVVVSDAAPRRNGVGTYYSDLIDHLRDEVETIRLIAAGDPDQPMRHWYEAGLPGDDTQRVALPSPFELHRAIADARPDVLIVATPGPYGVLAGLMAKGLGARLIFGLHTDYEALATLYWGRLRGPINRWFMARINGLLFRRAAVVVSNSAHMHRLAADKGAQRVERVHTPIPRDFLDTEPAALELPPERILFVGRLAAEKRVGTVIAAAEAHPQCQFEIVGEGPERETVRAAAERLDNLTDRGWLDRCQLRDALDASDLLILPSRVEAFGTVALEAMVRGRLALVSPGCGIADWPEFADGLLVMEQDETVTQALDRILEQSPTVLAECGATARRQAAAMTRRCVHEWLSLIHP